MNKKQAELQQAPHLIEPPKEIRAKQHRAMAVGLKIDAHIEVMGGLVQILDACTQMGSQ